MQMDWAVSLLVEILSGRDIQGQGRIGPISVSQWDDIIRESYRHHMSPLLYQRLKTSDLFQYIPDTVMPPLHEMYLRNAANNVRIYHRLAAVLKILKDAAIPVIVLKGAHLAETVYSNTALRMMDDVDILVRKSDLALCQRRLWDMGYYPCSEHLPLDIHWEIDLSIHSLNIDLEGIWSRSRREVIAGVETLVLSTEDLILHLCVHLAFHHLFRFTGLRTLYDIKEIIRHSQGQVAWVLLLRRAREWGIGNAVYLTLSFARDFFHARVPNCILDALRPMDSVPHVKSWAFRQIFQKRYTEEPLSPYFWLLWKPSSIREKVSHLLKLLFTEPEFLSQNYPTNYGAFRSFLFYMIRFKDHFSRYLHAILRMVVREDKMVMLAEREISNMAMREWLSSP